MSMTGIYGEPLERVRTWLQASAAFAAFAPALTVHVYERIGSAVEPVVGDAWAIVSYPENGHNITLVPGLDLQRQLEVCLTQCVAGITEAAKESIITSAGAIVADLMASADAYAQLTSIKLKTIAIDETTTPRQIGAIITLYLDLGGR